MVGGWQHVGGGRLAGRQAGGALRSRRVFVGVPVVAVVVVLSKRYLFARQLAAPEVPEDVEVVVYLFESRVVPGARVVREWPPVSSA